MKNLDFLNPVEDIYTLPFGERWMLFSPRTMTSAMVNEAAVKALAAFTVDPVSGTPGAIKSLFERLTDNPRSLNQYAASLEKLVIIPTRSCNMRCVYCDFDPLAIKNTTLDPGLACKLIDYSAERLAPKPSSVLRIHFFGGEPLVARQCVETAVHYSRMVCAWRNLVPWFEITTNGFFDPTAIPLIGDYMDSAVISIDGNAPFHDFNRRRPDGSGTYGVVSKNIRSLSRFPVELSLRACITQQSVDAMTDIASHFCQEFDFDLLCFEMMTPNPPSCRAGLTPPDARRFAAGVLKAEAIAGKYNVRVIQGPSELVGPRRTSCPVGLGTLMLTPEGLLTACYLETQRWTSLGIDPVLGRVDPDSGPIIEPEKIDGIAALLDSKPRCNKCFCRHTCAGGCHIEQTSPGCSLEYDNRCRATRMVTAGRLLRNLEGQTAAEAFVDNPGAVQSIADHPDDRLSTWILREKEKK